MQPIVISDTIQKFGAVRYYRCGKYFQNKGIRLHRVVWHYHNGPIPEGCHIHHKDEDRSHNWSGNLECLSEAEHLGGRHGQESGERGRKTIPSAVAAAAQWHQSPEGLAWHKELGRKLRGRKITRYIKRCLECGLFYEGHATSKYCIPACKARALRKRRKATR